MCKSCANQSKSSPLGMGLAMTVQLAAGQRLTGHLQHLLFLALQLICASTKRCSRSLSAGSPVPDVHHPSAESPYEACSVAKLCYGPSLSLLAAVPSSVTQAEH